MNKIITINIGGIAISIEEDAYDVLREYIKNLRNHFANTENGDEIVADIEQRIAEVLKAKLEADKIKVSINVADVKDVADMMGYPSDFEAEEEPDEKGTNAQSSYRSSTRKLFRDSEDKRIGGVCGGLAKYFDVDPTVLRIIWVVSILVFGFGFWIYIILWAVLPEARTTAEKLQMKGEAPTVDNITKTIEREAKEVYNRLTNDESTRSAGRFFDRFAHFVGRVFGGFFKILAVVIFVGIIVLLVSAAIGLIFNGTVFPVDMHWHITGRDIYYALQNERAWVFRIASFLTVALPLLYLGMKILPEIVGVPKPSRPVRQGILSAWIIAIVVAISSVFYNMYQYKEVGTASKQQEILIDSDTIIVRVDDVLMRGFENTGNRVRLDVVQQTGNNIGLSIEKTARGQSEADAEREAENIVDSYKVVGNTLLISERVLLREGEHAQIPNMDLILRLPVGKTVLFHENTRHVIHDIRNLQNVYDPHMAGRMFKMTSAGLDCMDCPPDIIEKRYEWGNHEFDRVDLEGLMNVRIIEGESCRVVMPKNHRLNSRVEMRIERNELKLEQDNDLAITLDMGEEILVYLPNLRGLKTEGASQVDVLLEGRQKPYFDLNVRGAGKVEVRELNSNKVSATIEGAGKATLDGRTDLFLLEMGGAARCYAYGLKAESVNADLEGACKAEITSISDLSGDLSGASRLSYRGKPNTRVDASEGSRLSAERED